MTLEIRRNKGYNYNTLCVVIEGKVRVTVITLFELNPVGNIVC